MHDPDLLPDAEQPPVPSSSTAHKALLGCGAALFLTLISLAIGLRVWSRWAITTTSQLSTPARPSVPVVYQPGPGLPAGYEHVVAVPSVGVSPGIRKGSLAWEIVRQGFLISAQDELGIDVLDESLNDVIPAADPPQSFPVLIQMVAWRKSNASVFPETGPNETIVGIEVYRDRLAGSRFQWIGPELNLPTETYFGSLSEKVEELSRTTFADVLEQAGCRRLNNSASQTALTVPAEDRMDIVSQYARLQRCRVEFQQDRESPKVLGDLVRAYANLGVLTDHHWSTSSKVFKARSLIYSQRLVRSETTPFTLAHRAYALAFAGDHKNALADLKQARTSSGEPTPEWLELLDDYCSYRPENLDQAAESCRELSLYLKMRMADPVNDMDRAQNAIQLFQASNPACSQSLEMLGKCPSLVIQQQLASDTYGAHWNHVYQRLTSAPGLPEEVRQAVDATVREEQGETSEYDRRRRILATLGMKPSNESPAGPWPWLTLANLLLDESFIQSWHIIDHEATVRHASCDPVLRDLKPLFAGHRHCKFLESYCDSDGESQHLLREYISEGHVYHLDGIALPIAEVVARKLGHGEGNRLRTNMGYQVDEVYEDLGPRNPAIFRDRVSNPRLVAVSPHWPQSAIASIRNSIDKDRFRLDELEQQFANEPAALNGLGRQHLELHETTDAIRCLTKSLNIYRNPTISQLLAKAYKDERDFANWERTLALSVGTDRLDADDTTVHGELADAWMRRGDFERAQPHVDMVATSDRESGLRFAIRCAEGREKWHEAEQFVQQLSRQSPDRASDWYFWCVRTGRGDIEAARQLAEESWKMLPDFPNADQLAALQVGQLLSGNESLCLLTCQKSFHRFRQMKDGGMVAVLADRQGKSDSRNAALRELAARWSPVDGVQSAPSGPGRRDRRRLPPFADLANLMAEVNAHGKWERNEFEFLIVNSDRAAIPWLYYLAGRFLCYHEQPELGREYLQQAISFPQLHSLVSVLAAHALRAEGVTIGEPHSNEVPESLAPAVSLLKHAADAFQRDDLDKALMLLDEMCHQFPQFLPGLVARGQIHEARSEYAAAIADYEAALRIDDGYSPAHFQLAWLRADCDQAQFLDGEKSVRHANRYLLKRRMKTSVSLSMLAAAQAQSGQFESAVLLEKDAQRLPGQELSEDYAQGYMNKKPRRRRPPTPLYLSVDEATAIDYDF